MSGVVVTGIGMLTPLGRGPREVFDRILAGNRAGRPHPFSRGLACPRFAPIEDFDAQQVFPDNKTLRLMNRDAQMAAAAARWAMRDAGVVPDETYPGSEIGLYGATGLSGLPIDDAARLVQYAAAADGSLDLARFGQVALKRIRPVLSFKILANMPICFVSIFENVRGPNAVYTPWEGQGAQAIAAGIRAIRRGDVPCALVGGCDVKTHALSFIALEQLGAFESWPREGRGCVPGEGAAFLVLEDEAHALRRRAHPYARLTVGQDFILSPVGQDCILSQETPSHLRLVSAADDPPPPSANNLPEASSPTAIYPKSHVGNLFAAAAAVQVALAAEWARRVGTSPPVLACCEGFGADRASFRLEAL